MFFRIFFLTNERFDEQEKSLALKIPGYAPVLGFCQICLNPWLFLLSI